MAVKFVRSQEGPTGQFGFKLVASNRQVIATSETYESKASAINGMESVKRKAPTLRSTSRPTRSPVPSRDALVGFASSVTRLRFLIVEDL
jgi:uncharacterized protein